MNDADVLSELETFFTALADKTRLRLLNLMREGEICVYFLVEVLEESQPKISRHLAFLRNAGIVEARREGKWIHYKIAEPKDDFAAQMLRNTLLWLDSQEKMRLEYEKLAIVCRLTDKQVTINPPSPSNISVSRNMRRNHSEELETFLL